MDAFTLLLQAARTQRLDWFRALNRGAKPGGLVLCGDSLTNEFLVHEMLFDETPRPNLHNRGIGGDTTAGVLERLPESILELHPARVILLIGTNDLAKGISPDTVLRHIEEIVTRCRAEQPEIDFVLESLYPVNETLDAFTVGARANEVICAVNERLRVLADDLGCRYWDMHALLTDEHGRLRKELTREGLHLNAAGYHVVLEPLRAFFVERAL